MLARAWECDWTRAVETLRGAVNLFVVARGFGLGIAQEAALKLKETCGLHAEAFSSAEVKHGPMALVRAGFPVLMFTQRDETRVGIQEVAAEFASRGARVLIAGAEAAGAISLPAIASHPVIEPLCNPEFLPHGERTGAGARPGSRPAATSQQSDRDRLMLLAFRNGRILTDAGIESGKTLLVRNGLIEAICGAREVIGPDRTIDLNGQLLVPGFIDTQVNGGGGVLFNDDPSVESIAAIGRAHRRFGTTGFLPTLISDDLHVVERAIDAVRDAIAQGVPGVLGIHIEGPFLSNERRGVHDSSKLRSLDGDAVDLLSTPHGGCDHGDTGARAHHAGHHPRAVRRGCHRVRRAHQRDLR
jgi:hypothetical protein